jgi:hypothetical protein
VFKEGYKESWLFLGNAVQEKEQGGVENIPFFVWFLRGRVNVVTLLCIPSF